MSRLKVRMLLFAGIFLFVCGCGNTIEETKEISLEQESEESSRYTTVKVQKGDVEEEIEIFCSYQPKEKVTCSFDGESKKIKEVLVEKGDHVTKGQILARLENDSLDEKIKEVQHKIEMAQLGITHAGELENFDLTYLDKEYHFIEEEERDGKEYEINKRNIVQKYTHMIEDLTDEITVGQIRLQEYQKEIEEGTIVAPDDGMITMSHSERVGQYSKPQEDVISMIRDGDLTFISDNIELEGYVEQGENYTVHVGKGDNTEQIEVVAHGVDEENGKLFFEIKVSNVKMDSGTMGTIWIPLKEKKDVLYVPNKALHKSGDKDYVYTMTQDGLRNIQYVTVGITGRENTEIIKGLTLDQYVITD